MKPDIGTSAPRWSDEFPQAPDLVYLNHAAVAPWPRRAQDAVTRFAEENVRLGASRYPQWLAVEAQTRERLARLINAPRVDDIALLKNTSEALSVVAHGLAWRNGDNVVITDEEFPSNRIVWESLRGRGVEVRAVPMANAAVPEEVLLAACDGRTRLMSVSSVQYATGRRLDLERLGAGCRQHRVLFCVDAIQSLGALQFDVEAVQADFVMADAHKWLLGPEGIALFYCRTECRDLLTLHQYGWHMIEKHGDFNTKTWSVAASARRFECGSPNMLGIHALNASLSLFEEIGMATVERGVMENAALLLESLSAIPGAELITPRAKGRYAGIVTFRHRDIPPAALVLQLRERNIICIDRGGGVRFSAHFYQSPNRLEKAVNAVRECQH